MSNSFFRNVLLNAEKQVEKHLLLIKYLENPLTNIKAD